uniref:Uncharacterized protein n=1 Tax=Anopheles melas TaxID=34690 RepID=A0A182TLG0_9DIPT
MSFETLRLDGWSRAFFFFDEDDEALPAAPAPPRPELRTLDVTAGCHAQPNAELGRRGGKQLLLELDNVAVQRGATVDRDALIEPDVRFIDTARSQVGAAARPGRSVRGATIAVAWSTDLRFSRSSRSFSFTFSLYSKKSSTVVTHLPQMYEFRSSSKLI